jgi:ATP-binding cassette subfamily B protein
MLAGERVIARLRRDLYQAILDQEIAFFDVERTGDLTSRLASDTATLQGAVSSNISIGLRNLIQLAGGIALLVFTSPRLTLVILAVVPAIAVSAVVYGRRIRRLARKVQDALAEGQAVAEESIAGVRTVRAFAAEEAEHERYGSAIARSLALARRRVTASSIFMSATSFAGYAAAALVFWWRATSSPSGTSPRSWSTRSWSASRWARWPTCGPSSCARWARPSACSSCSIGGRSCRGGAAARSSR